MSTPTGTDQREDAAIAVKVYRAPKPGEVARFIVRRWWIVLIFLALGGAGGFLLSKRYEPRYQSSASIRLDNPSAVKIGRKSDDEEKDEVPSGSVYVRTIATLLKDDLTIKPIITANVKDVPARHRGALKGVVERIAKATAVEWIRGHDYQIRVKTRSATLSQKVAAALAKRAMEEHRQRFKKKAIEFAKIAQAQLRETSKAIKAVEDEMVTFLNKHPSMRLKSLDGEIQGADRLRASAGTAVRHRSLKKLAESNPALRALVDRRRQLTRELQTLAQAGSGSTRALTEALDRARRELNKVRAGKTDSHPVVKRAQARVKAIEARIAAAAPGQRTAGSAYEAKVRAELTLLKAKIRREVGKLASKVKAKPKGDNVLLEAQWSKMRREHQRVTDQLKRFQKLAINAELKKHLRVYEANKTAKLIEAPTVSKKPVGLTGKKIQVGAIGIFFVLGLALAVGLGVLDIRLHDPAQIALATDDLTLLAVLHDQGNDGVEPLNTARLELNPTAAVEAPATAQASGNGDGPGVIRWLKDLDLDSALDAMASQSGDNDHAKDRRWNDDMATGFFDANTPAALGARISAERSRGRLAGPQDGAMVLASEFGAASGNGAPDIPKQRVHPPPPNLSLAPGVFVASSPRGKAAEQVRLLAARVQTALGKNLRAIGVASWESGAGRTTVAGNLATALAQSQKRVLMIDACPRTAALTHMFGIDVTGVGLFEQLQRWLDKCAEPWGVVQVAENLNIIPAVVDTETPALPLLLSEAFVRLVSDMTQLYDVLVIDTEALQVVSDSMVLKRLIDGYVMVTRRRHSTTRTLHELGTRVPKGDIFGLVFNQHA